MPSKDQSPSALPKKERAVIVNPPVQQSFIVHQLEQVQPIRARLEEVKLSRYVIQPRVQRAVVVNIPPSRSGQLVEPPPIPVNIGQARLVTDTLHRANVEKVVGQAVQMNAPVMPTQQAVLVNPPAPVAQMAPVVQAAPPPAARIQAAAVRPTRYLYVPGLAQDQYVQNPCTSIDGFCNRVKTAFGFRVKEVSGGRERTNRTTHDPFMTESVSTLCNQKGVVPINCGRAFRWVMITTTEMDVYASECSAMRYLDAGRKMYTSKAFKVLGAPQDNYMALNPGPRTPPKELAYDINDVRRCVGAEYSAQRKAFDSDAQDGAARIELRPLEHLRDDDLLYIVGHGNQRGGTLTYKIPVPASHRVHDQRVAEAQPGVCGITTTHNEKWYVDPLALAVLLRDEGLPKTHKLIEMWMCYGAGMALAGEQTVQSYCQRLAGALGGFGYKRIKVQGVLGLTYGDLSINPTLRPYNPSIDGPEKAGQLVISTGDKVMPNTPAHAKLFRTFAAK